MTDKQAYDRLDEISAALKKMQSKAPINNGCSCGWLSGISVGHCLHHSTYLGHIDDALKSVERAQQQLRFPNGAGDKAAW